MSDHWEEVGWDKEELSKANVSPTWYLDGQVAMLEPVMDPANRYMNARPIFLAPMHGGIWTMCITLTGELSSEILIFNNQSSQWWMEKYKGVIKELHSVITGAEKIHRLGKAGGSGMKLTFNLYHSFTFASPFARF